MFKWRPFYVSKFVDSWQPCSKVDSVVKYHDLINTANETDNNTDIDDDVTDTSALPLHRTIGKKNIQ